MGLKLFAIFSFLLLQNFLPVADSKAHKKFVKNVLRENSDSYWKTLDGSRSKIVGHRGEKVLMPQHTLPSYHIAAIQDPDFVEPDLVLTKDGHLVCFHDLNLKSDTNIGEIEDERIPESKNYSITVGNKTFEFIDDWIIPDLNLEQIKLLKVNQKSIGIRPLYFNDKYEIPTFEEYLDLMHTMNLKLNKSLGVIPELKHPEISNVLQNKPNYMEDIFLEVIKNYGYALTPNDTSNCKTPQNESVTCGHIVIQCFNKDSLAYIKTKAPIIDLMMLVDDDPYVLTMSALSEISKFSKYYSILKEHVYSGIIPTLKAENISYEENIIKNAGGFIPHDNFTSIVHGMGMELGIYTIYDSREPSRRGCAIKCEEEDKKAELFYYFSQGVDALFVENIKEAVELRMEYDFEMKLSSSGASNWKFNTHLIITSLIAVLSKRFF